MAPAKDLFWLTSRETMVGRGYDVFVRSSYNESGPYKCNRSWGKRNTFSRLLPDGGRTGNADQAATRQSTCRPCTEFALDALCASAEFW